HLVYDAWNRLVAVSDSGNTPLQDYQYDSLGRRIVEETPGTAGSRHDLYYSAAWQVVEERVGDPGAVATHVYTEYVWSALYVDALLLRRRDADGQSSNGLEETLYALHDANWNVTALVPDLSGTPVERYVYD